MIEARLAGPVGRDFTLDVRLAVPADGVTALLGASGSGKTTLLRVLAGLERIPGTVRVAGETWQDGAVFLPPHRRRVGYVFQGAGLLPHLSVSGNLRYAARRAPAGSVDSADIIRRTGIAGLLGRCPARLSGGEAQRVSIARALCSQPRLLLLDEPLSALDRGSRDAMLESLDALFAALAIPVVYVTHDESEAAWIARRIIRLSEGRLTSDQRPAS